MTESELKDRLKNALAEANLGYPWLAEKLGITRCTLNNYMAKKPIPAGLRPLMEEILNKLESGQNDIIAAPPLKKKRHRRTNEQIRKDLEESMRKGQEKMALEGYDDSDDAERKWKEYGNKALEEYKTREKELLEEYAKRELHDMNSDTTPVVQTFRDGIIFKIAIPQEIMDIYMHEVENVRRMNLGDPYDTITIEQLISRAITEDAWSIRDADKAKPFFLDKLQAFRDKWQLTTDSDN